MRLPQSPPQPAKRRTLDPGQVLLVAARLVRRSSDVPSDVPPNHGAYRLVKRGQIQRSFLSADVDAGGRRRQRPSDNTLLMPHEMPIHPGVFPNPQRQQLTGPVARHTPGGKLGRRKGAPTMSTPEQPKVEPPARWEDLRADGTYEHNPFAADVTPNGVNRSALRRNRALTPEERLRRMVASARQLQKLRGSFRPSRRDAVRS